MKKSKGKGKRRFIIFLAIVLVAIGAGSTLYITSFKETEKAEGLLVGKREFSLKELFGTSELIRIGEYQGVALKEVITKAEIESPERQEYTIIAEDGYQKRVGWESIQGGIFTRERRVIFPDLPKQYWIKNTVRIEVSGENE